MKNKLILLLSLGLLPHSVYAADEVGKLSGIWPCYNFNELKSKLSDADGENSETQLWLDFAVACKYISEDKRNELQYKREEIGKLLNYMMNNPDKFGV